MARVEVEDAIRKDACFQLTTHYRLQIILKDSPPEYLSGFNTLEIATKLDTAKQVNSFLDAPEISV